MISKKDMELTEDLLVDELKKVIKKGELKDVNEAKAVKEVLESIKIIHCLRDGEMEDEGYSGRMMPHYSGHHGDMNYAGNMNFDGNYSGRRSPTTGRYMSHGYSGHSVHDRMIAALEGLHDDPAFAGKPYENEEINKWIDRLRTNN